MKKLFAITALVFASNVFAGSSSINLTYDYQQVFTTPSGNVLCGGDSLKRKGAKIYAHDVYCFAYTIKSEIARCKTKGEGLDFMLNRTGKAKQQCATFEFTPDNVGEEQTRTLPYGKTLRGKGWSCTSEITGLTCKNNDGHGFKINRSRYEMF